VDWGTSNMKAFLCRNQVEQPYSGAEPVAVVNGPGIGMLKESVPVTLFAAIKPWIDEWGKLPIIMSGMVGANIGWVSVPYASCPVDPAQLLQSCHRFDYQGHAVVIVPGVACRDSAARREEVMRGEELQVLGWLEENARNARDTHQQTNSRDTHLICLPGTHTKWVLIKQGVSPVIEYFFTALTGELFALLNSHSVLLSKTATFVDNQHAFLQGVKLVKDNAGENLIHQLFQVRSQQVNGNLPESYAHSYLSGILIGADVSGALRKFRQMGHAIHDISILGNDSLNWLFASALETLQGSGTDAFHIHRHDVTDITLTGFYAIYRSLFRGGQQA
jgi:2-dehydro-3-deoxygalactonokinase